MKNTIKVLGIIAIIAVIGFSMAACGSEDVPTKEEIQTAVTSAVYRGMDSAANIYELAISKTANRAAFAPIAGDDYVLTVTPPNGTGKKSEGAVDQSVDGGFSLKPKGATKVFNVAVDGGNMVAIAGDVKYTDGTTDTAKATGLLPPPASGDTTISGNTFVSGVNVAYDHRIANLTAAKAATSFPYKLSMDNGKIRGDDITQFVSGSSVTVSGGKLTITIGNIDSSLLTPFDPEQFAGYTITPNDSKYFGNPDETVVFMNVGGTDINPETSTGYGLICLKSDTEYAGIVYVDKDTKVKGSAEHDGVITVMDLDAKAGWSYIFVTQTGKFVTIATSKRLPASYKWTVIDFNFPLEFHGGNNGGQQGGDNGGQQGGDNGGQQGDNGGGNP